MNVSITFHFLHTTHHHSGEPSNDAAHDCKIPVFHDDQHGTAIVTAAGMLNALEIQQKIEIRCCFILSAHFSPIIDFFKIILNYSQFLSI